MERFEVSPPELEGAAHTLGASRARSAVRPAPAQSSESPELQAAVAAAFEAADSVALAMADALAGASRNASATASRYAGTEAAATSSLNRAGQALPEAQTQPSPGAP